MITNMPKVALSLNETGCQCGLAVFFLLTWEFVYYNSENSLVILPSFMNIPESYTCETRAGHLEIRGMSETEKALKGIQ